MKLAIFSDFHVDFHKDRGRSVFAGLSKDADVAVVAGDMAAFYDFETGICDFCSEYPNVVYVAGNHEYYHSAAFDQVNNILLNLESKLDNFTWLNNKRVKIEGQYFIGATLWFQRTVAAQINKHGFNDFRYVPNCDPFAFDEFDYTKKYFEIAMEQGDIVITHHAPSFTSIHPKFFGSDMNCYFANRLDSLIIDKKPKIWIHGHMHDGCDYTIGNTQIICNPFGYPGENRMFNDGLIVEI